MLAPAGTSLLRLAIETVLASVGVFLEFTALAATFAGTGLAGNGPGAEWVQFLILYRDSSKKMLSGGGRSPHQECIYRHGVGLVHLAIDVIPGHLLLSPICDGTDVQGKYFVHQVRYPLWGLCGAGLLYRNDD